MGSIKAPCRDKPWVLSGHISPDVFAELARPWRNNHNATSPGITFILKGGEELAPLPIQDLDFVKPENLDRNHALFLFILESNSSPGAADIHLQAEFLADADLFERIDNRWTEPSQGTTLQYFAGIRFRGNTGLMSEGVAGTNIFPRVTLTITQIIPAEKPKQKNACPHCNKGQVAIGQTCPFCQGADVAPKATH